IGSGSQEFGLLPIWMDELIAAVSRWTILFQDPVHRPNGAQILTVIQQSGVDGGGSAILKTIGIQHGEEAFSFAGTQRARWCGAGERYRNRFRKRRPEQLTTAIERSPRNAEHVPRGLYAA